MREDSWKNEACARGGVDVFNVQDERRWRTRRKEKKKKTKKEKGEKKKEDWLEKREREYSVVRSRWIGERRNFSSGRRRLVEPVVVN